MLCKLCSALEEDYLAPGKMLDPDTPPLPLLDMGFRHHESLRDMRAMAGDGCELCSFYFEASLTAVMLLGLASFLTQQRLCHLF
jgi:hypothetical protein